MRFYFSFFLLFLFNFEFYAQNQYDIRFLLTDVDCDAKTACYDVQLRASSGTYGLAGQNYRIFYDASKADYVSGFKKLDSKYGNFDLVQDVSADATGYGTLPFESTLGFLNYAIDLNDVETGGATLTSEWLSTSNLCFNILTDDMSSSDACVDLVWGRDNLTNGYATAFVEVSEWVSYNYTTNTVGFEYFDLLSADGNDACFSAVCTSTLDDDGDGVSNSTETNDGTNPNDPCEYLETSQDINLTSTSWQTLDCDNDGINNIDEVNQTSSPLDHCDPNPCDYNIRFELQNIDCINNTFCYEVQLSSSNGLPVNLAGQNYRLYFDGSKMQYESGYSLLPLADYTDFTLVQNIENVDADIVNSNLTFESNLSFLNYTMDLNDIENGGIVLPADGSWVGTSVLCFSAKFDITEVPATCIEAVWAREGLTDAYATAFVEVAKWVSTNNTVMAVGATYDDLDQNDSNNLCSVADCDEDGNPNVTDPNPDVPTAVDDAFTAPVGTATTTNILTNDDFLPGANTTITTQPGGTAGGTISYDPLTGEITYTPLASEAGTTQTVEYQVCNTAVTPAVCDIATVTITIGADPDTDGDGEPDSTDPAPTDPCVWSATHTPTLANTTTAWQGGDCDGDGVTNGSEIDPAVGPVTDPLDPCSLNISEVTLTATSTGDCDGDGVTNADEINTTGPSDPQTDPTDPCAYNEAEQGTPSAAWNSADCDGDGNPNGTDPNPLVPTAVDDAFTAPVGTATTTNILTNDDFLPGANTTITTQPGGTAGGTISYDPLTGEMTYTPLASEAGTTQTVEYQVCNTAVTPAVCDIATVTITIGADPDTDGDGEPDSTDPAPTDPCVWSATHTPTLANTTTAWQGGDCDGDGVTNGSEIDPAVGPVTDPLDPCSLNLTEVTLTATSTGDCDGDGVTNADEINTTGPSDPQTDPTDPCAYNDEDISLPITSDLTACEMIPCSTQETLDWTVNASAAGDLSNSYTIAGSNISFSVFDPSGSLVGSPIAAPGTGLFYQGDQATLQTTLLFATNLDVQQTMNDVTIALDLGIEGIGLNGVNFNIYDVDGELGSFLRQEKYIITGFLDGVEVKASVGWFWSSEYY
ncbi:MAG: Ig-like domain-containing protein [Saprospiraceae bacterium]